MKMREPKDWLKTLSKSRLGVLIGVVKLEFEGEEYALKSVKIVDCWGHKWLKDGVLEYMEYYAADCVCSFCDGVTDIMFVVFVALGEIISKPKKYLDVVYTTAWCKKHYKEG